VAEKVKSANGTILHGPFKLPPHDEHVVIVADPDMYEYCFVGMTGYRAGSLSVKNKTIDWDHRNKLIAAASSPAPATHAPVTSPAPTASHTPAGGVVHITSEAEYNVIKNSGKVMVVDFSSAWCKPCKKIAPAFKKFAGQYNGAVFVKIDTDECSTFMDVHSVTVLPTFMFFRDGLLLGQHTGSSEAELEEHIKKFCA